MRMSYQLVYQVYNRQNSKMYYQTGNMRDINNNMSPLKSAVVWDRDNELDYTHRSKYQKSQASYAHPQKSKLHYEQQLQTQRQQAHRSLQPSQLCIHLPIKIKSTERQDYTANFKIQLLNQTDKNNNCFVIHITNDNDSLFLWSFYVREAEYLNLKNLLCLKVDFHGFPQVIISYLNQCTSNSGSMEGSSISKYYAVLDIKKGGIQAQFKIMQANKFKQSLHFSLIFKKANDEQIKNYLSQKFDKERNQSLKLNKQLMETQNQSNIRLKNLEKLRIQFEQMQKQKNQQIFQLQRRQKQRIKQVTLRYQQQNMKRKKTEDEKNNRSVNQLNDKIQELMNKNSELFENYQKANQRIITLEASQNNLKSKCSILQTQTQTQEKSLKQLKIKQSKINEQYHLLMNQNTKLSCTIQSLEDKVREKDQRLSENTEVKSNNYNQIAGLEQNLRQQKQKNGKLEQKILTMEQEISKLQKKSEDLMNKYQKKKDKANQMKNLIIKQQDQIDQFQKKQLQQKSNIATLTQESERLQLELKDRQIKMKDLKKHIEQNQQHIENQQKIISQLHKKLNERAIGVKNISIPSTLPTYTGPSYTAFSSTGSIGRQFSSTLSSTSQSRIKYSPSPLSTTSPIIQKQSQRVAPPFRKYRQGIENDKDQQNSHQSHSRSPIVNKLSQQLDPEQNDKTRHKIAPVKFSK